MNKLSRALGRWLFIQYKCSLCKKSMNIHEGLILDPKDNTKVIHKGCKHETSGYNKKSV